MGKERKCTQCSTKLTKYNTTGTWCTPCHNYGIQNPGHEYYDKIGKLFSDPRTFSGEIPFFVQTYGEAGNTFPKGAYNYHAWVLYIKYGIPQDATIAYINRFGAPFNLPYVGFKTK